MCIKLLEPSRRFRRTELFGMLVPEASLRDIGSQSVYAKPLDQIRVKGAAELQGCLCSSGFGRSPQKQSR